MPGEISLSLEREPDYFAAAEVEGPRHQVIVARAPETGRLLGAGSRSVRECFVDGRPVLLPYLGTLRVAGEARGRLRLLRAGYALCRTLRQADETRYALTSIVEDNAVARRLLEAGLEGLPAYREVERLVTLVIPTSGWHGGRKWRSPRVGRGRGESLAAIAARLDCDYRRYQFAPRWRLDDLLSPIRTPGVEPGDFHVVEEAGQIRGCLAVWDQRPFKQTVVRGYGERLRRVRPIVNLAAPWTGAPHLPAPGGRVEHAYLSHVAVGGDPGTLPALIASALDDGRARGCGCLVAGFSERNPLLRTVRRSFRHRAYRSVLYLVYWPEGRAAAEALGDRPAHVEVATL